VVGRHGRARDLRLAQCHSDGLLRRRQCGLKPVRRMATILDAVALAPFINGLRGNPERSASAVPASPLAWIAARTFGVVVACL